MTAREDLRERTIFEIAPNSAPWGVALGLAVCVWLGATVYIGQYRPTQVSAVLAGVAPPLAVFAAAVAGCVAALLMPRRRAVAAGAVAAAFLLGHISFGWLYSHLPARFAFPLSGLDDAWRFALARLAYLAGTGIPMWAAFVLTRTDSATPLALGVGDLRVRVRDASASEAPKPVWLHLCGGYLLFIAVFAVLLQANAGFVPLRSGALWKLLPAVLIAAAANAITEEYLFRGLLQPALASAAGPGVGIWATGLAFGLLHWGSTVGLLAALPLSLGLGFGSVVWGKYAWDTRGMAAPVIAHFLADAAIMAAFFV